MSAADHSFLFSSLSSKQPTTARKAHIRRLFDILQLCVQRHDWVRAKRAWAILVRCREVDWKAMWTTSILLLQADDPDAGGAQSNAERVRFLGVMMRQHPDEVRLLDCSPQRLTLFHTLTASSPSQRESILKELVLRLIQDGRCKRAMEELDLCVPSLAPRCTTPPCLRSPDALHQIPAVVPIPGQPYSPYVCRPDCSVPCAARQSYLRGDDVPLWSVHLAQ